jgi:HSP20 family protein
MRSRIQSVLLPSELGEFADEVRRIFLELGRTFGAVSMAGECSPGIDVFETDDAIEVLVDLPGVDKNALRVIAKGDTLLIIGDKASRRPRSDSTFHLVERGFGRFARAVRLAGACDPGRARASLQNGELRISVPKGPERRGRAIPIAVESARPSDATPS